MFLSVSDTVATTGARRASSWYQRVATGGSGACSVQGARYKGRYCRVRCDSTLSPLLLRPIRCHSTRCDRLPASLLRVSVTTQQLYTLVNTNTVTMHYSIRTVSHLQIPSPKSTQLTQISQNTSHSTCLLYTSPSPRD